MSLHAQLINNQQGQAFTELPFFTADSLKKHQIKGFKGKFNIKKMRHPMVETDFELVYSFDEHGRFIQHYETQAIGKILDTLVISYLYYPTGDLKLIRREDRIGFLSTHYFYDEKKRVIRTEIHRDVDTGGTEIQPLFSGDNLLDFETFHYDSSENQIKKTSYNRYDIPYQTEISYYENGKLTVVETTLLRTQERTKTEYSFDEKGNLIQLKTFDVKTPEINQEFRFTYDKFKNLLEKKTYKNGEFLSEISVIYNYQTGLLSSILTHDLRTNDISIVRFENYVYY